MIEYPYRIGLDGRPINTKSAMQIIEMSSQPAYLEEHFNDVAPRLFQNPAIPIQMFHTLGRGNVFQQLEEQDKSPRENYQELESYRQSMLTGFQQALVVFYYIRNLGGYKETLPANLQLQDPGRLFSEDFQTTSSTYNELAQTARLTILGCKQGSELSRPALLVGTDIGAYLLALRHQELILQFETSDLRSLPEAPSDLRFQQPLNT